MTLIDHLGPHDSLLRQRLEKNWEQISSQLADGELLGIVPVSVVESTASKVFFGVLDAALTATGSSGPVRFTSGMIAVTSDHVLLLHNPTFGGKWKAMARNPKSSLGPLHPDGKRHVVRIGKYTLAIERPEFVDEYHRLAS